MSENETALDTTADKNATEESNDQPQEASTENQAAPVSMEEITYHAVEKDGQVTAIWEMQGRKHIRTIDPRSRQGQEILRLYTSEHHDDANATHTTEAASS